MFKKVCILAGNSHPELAGAIATFLETPLGKSKMTRFSDGESFVEIGENVRGVDAFVIQPTCSPVNDSLWARSSSWWGKMAELTRPMMHG